MEGAGTESASARMSASSPHVLARRGLALIWRAEARLRGRGHPYTLARKTRAARGLLRPDEDQKPRPSERGAATAHQLLRGIAMTDAQIAAVQAGWPGKLARSCSSERPLHYCTSQRLVNLCPCLCRSRATASSSHSTPKGSLSTPNSVSLMKPVVKQRSLYSPTTRLRSQIRELANAVSRHPPQ